MLAKRIRAHRGGIAGTPTKPEPKKHALKNWGWGEGKPAKDLRYSFKDDHLLTGVGDLLPSQLEVRNMPDAPPHVSLMRAVLEQAMTDLAMWVRKYDRQKTIENIRVWASSKEHTTALRETTNQRILGHIRAHGGEWTGTLADLSIYVQKHRSGVSGISYVIDRLRKEGRLAYEQLPLHQRRYFIPQDAPPDPPIPVKVKLTPHSSNAAKLREELAEISDAEEWFASDARGCITDFVAICEAMNLEPDAVRRKLRELGLLAKETA